MHEVKLMNYNAETGENYDISVIRFMNGKWIDAFGRSLTGANRPGYDPRDTWRFWVRVLRHLGDG